MTPDVLKRFLVALVLAAACQAACGGELQAKCWSTATTQAELTVCGAEESKAADDELNRIYQAILARYKGDDAFLEKLKAAQSAWIAFRDAELEAIYPREDEPGYYGSSHRMCLGTRLAELTRARIHELRRWLGEPEEDDVCAGSTSGPEL